jgi:predicted nucleic acid-binding Zn ribbon protein
MPNKNRLCVVCLKEINKTNRPNSEYCSSMCANKRAKLRRANINRLNGIVPQKNMGAYSELIVMLELFEMGYEVYRAVSQHCSGDIIAGKGETLVKLDATTGYVNKNGSVAYPPKKTDAIIAVYLVNEKRVVYLKNGIEINMAT